MSTEKGIEPGPPTGSGAAGPAVGMGRATNFGSAAGAAGAAGAER